MKKIICILGLVSALLTMTILVVSADPPTPPGKPTTPPGQQKGPPDDKGKQQRNAIGVVVFKGSDTFTVATKQGENVVVKVQTSTRFHISTLKNASFADLQKDDRVAVNGTPTDNGLVAKKVSIVPGKPSIQHRVGIVEKIVPGVSITIKTIQGVGEQFTLTKDTEIRGKDKIEVGDRVTVVSRRDPGTREMTARAIVVHPQ